MSDDEDFTIDASTGNLLLHGGDCCHGADCPFDILYYSFWLGSINRIKHPTVGTSNLLWRVLQRRRDGCRGSRARPPTGT